MTNTDPTVTLIVDTGDGNSFTLNAPLPGGGNPRFHAYYVEKQLQWLQPKVNKILEQIHGEQSDTAPLNDPNRPR